ncbi:hypothetical protein G7B40_025680 [Aetokthonos hydrillicola Thurmond2011]|jgi:hypothetical protein|uniref:Uncharacterized protein n=1 Tax=Aetokthonos hydrillicola Thurmond2011 TaxID=2712845 RepID=A0AAP5IAI3_9CYAN|nr:hypothetical protein [Aetokthonos hydrillicola]MBO3460695.1 hypothetical protein [Aetokthonos hydrillicola CCALA 1050]MBW4587692.1 hypothetical protein [Aetokthonos hydrillicola CCALA 1050]MDR9897926.1 hypothetical protein [Aetokthonos hydrillicola Thurmond2011]
MKSIHRHAILLACSLVLLLLPTGCYEVSVSFEQPATEASPTQSAQTSDLQKTDSSIALQGANASTVTKQTNSVLVSQSNNNQKAQSQGSLRISNQTEQPVRLALLERHLGRKSSTKNDIPAHWDFAPKEGSEKGLVLSLPKGKLKLEKGDILVAFAQDGSRSYWGPYVVGETPLPSWSTEKAEWQLVISQ